MTPGSAGTSYKPPLDLRLDQAHSARMYDYFLGGKTNYGPDRAAAAAVLNASPAAATCARENRAFMHRVTRVLATEYGIRQWLDIGTGIPTRPNLHEVAQGVASEARVVYVDNDPIVLAHARALLNSTSEGRTAYIQAEATDPEAILASDELTETLDLTKPVALSLNALLHFMPDSLSPYGLVRHLMEALPSGSALAISHGTPDFDPPAIQAVHDIYTAAGTPVQFRTKDEFSRFFDGYDLLDPGVVVGHRWRPLMSAEPLRIVGGELTDTDVNLWTAVAIKP